MVSKGKFGLINENGREIIPAKYEDVGNFPVLRDKKTGALLDEAAFYTKADQSLHFRLPSRKYRACCFPNLMPLSPSCLHRGLIIFISLIRNPKGW